MLQIETIVSNNAVGANLYDHLLVALFYGVEASATIGNIGEMTTVFGRLKNYLQYLWNSTGEEQFVECYSNTLSIRTSILLPTPPDGVPHDGSSPLRRVSIRHTDVHRAG